MVFPKKANLLQIPATLLSTFPKENQHVRELLALLCLFLALFIIDKMWKQLMYPSVDKENVYIHSANAVYICIQMENDTC
jgi:hypothetical protein